MSKYTPGPWTISRKKKRLKKDSHEHGYIFRILGNGKCIFGLADIEGPSNKELLGECIANARLIAAAPDLLEACKLTCKLIRDTVSEYHLLDIKKRWTLCTSMAQLTTAIAKAEGQTYV